MDCSFRPDRKFNSRAEALTFIRSNGWEHMTWPVPRPLPSAECRFLPRFLFRGENGDWPQTTCSVLRPAKGYDPLSTQERTEFERLISRLISYLQEESPHWNEITTRGLLQHYGLPTRMIDFSCALDVAVTFASRSSVPVARIAVIDLKQAYGAGVGISDLRSEVAGSRPQRQQAFGLFAPEGYCDLKSQQARDNLGIRWLEFPVEELEREARRFEDLTSVANDPLAGILRRAITDYVESFGKLSPAVVERIQEVPFTPHCFYLISKDDIDVHARRVSASELGVTFVESDEKERSRRYWSTQYSDDSFDRLKEWRWPEIGAFVIDPRTYHPEDQCA